MDQNEATKHFSVGNTFCQASMHARIFRIRKKKGRNTVLDYFVSRIH